MTIYEALPFQTTLGDLENLVEAKTFGMSYQDYCDNFPALITELKYNELVTEVIYHKGN